MIQMERSVAGIYLHTMFLDKLIIAMQQEMHLLSAVCQFAAVIAADGTHSNDPVSHILVFFPAKLQLNLEMAKETIYIISYTCNKFGIFLHKNFVFS